MDNHKCPGFWWKASSQSGNAINCPLCIRYWSFFGAFVFTFLIAGPAATVWWSSKMFGSFPGPQMYSESMLTVKFLLEQAWVSLIAMVSPLKTQAAICVFMFFGNTMCLFII